MLKEDTSLAALPTETAEDILELTVESNLIVPNDPHVNAYEMSTKRARWHWKESLPKPPSLAPPSSSSDYPGNLDRGFDEGAAHASGASEGRGQVHLVIDLLARGYTHLSITYG